MKTEKTVVQVLREAKYALSERGWIKGTYGTIEKFPNGTDVGATGIRRDFCRGPTDAQCFCTMGAIAFAAGQNFGFAGEHVYEQYLVKALSLRTGEDLEPNTCRVPAYNDKDSTTLENILSLFDEAIDLAKQKEAN